MAGDERSSGVIGGLALRFDRNRHATERARNSLRHAPGAEIAFDGKNHAVELRHVASAERLHGMKRTGRSAFVRERRKNVARERTARVQYNFTATFLSARSRERVRHLSEGSVGSGKQNHVRAQHVAGQARMRLPGTDRADRGASGGRRPRDDGADLPAKLMKASSQCSAHASRADDGNGTSHST